MQKIPGTKSIDVDFETKVVTIEMMEGQALTLEACEEALAGSRYTVASFETRAAAPADDPS
jgi:copper chaperone CopZ